jgi:hypothetical protein
MGGFYVFLYRWKTGLFHLGRTYCKTKVPLSFPGDISFVGGDMERRTAFFL